MWNEKRYTRAKHRLAALACLSCLTGCASVTPMPSIVTSYSAYSDYKAADFGRWCAQGMRAACIDQHQHNLSSDPTSSRDIEALEDYCRQGHGSACFYLSPYRGQDALDEACNLNEARGCQEGAKPAVKKPSVRSCPAARVAAAPVEPSQPREASASWDAKAPELISEAIKAQVLKFRYCHGRKLWEVKSSQYPRAPHGKVSIMFLITPVPAVVNAPSLICSDVRDDELNQCVMDVLKTADVSALKPPSVITVKKSFVFDLPE